MLLALAETLLLWLSPFILVPTQIQHSQRLLLQWSHVNSYLLLVVQSLSHIRLFGTPWTAATRPPCPSLSLRVCTSPCLLSQWCHPTTSSSVVPFSSPQFSSVPQWCPTLCDPMDSAHQASLFITNPRSLFKLMSIESVFHPVISCSVVPFSFRLQSFPASGSFPMSQFFESGGQSIGALASAEWTDIHWSFQWIFRTDFL